MLKLPDSLPLRVAFFALFFSVWGVLTFRHSLLFFPFELVWYFGLDSLMIVIHFWLWDAVLPFCIFVFVGLRIWRKPRLQSWVIPVGVAIVGSLVAIAMIMLLQSIQNSSYAYEDVQAALAPYAETDFGSADLDWSSAGWQVVLPMAYPNVLNVLVFWFGGAVLLWWCFLPSRYVLNLTDWQHTPSVAKQVAWRAGCWLVMGYCFFEGLIGGPLNGVIYWLQVAAVHDISTANEALQYSVNSFDFWQAYSVGWAVPILAMTLFAYIGMPKCRAWVFQWAWYVVIAMSSSVMAFSLTVLMWFVVMPSNMFYTVAGDSYQYGAYYLYGLPGYVWWLVAMLILPLAYAASLGLPHRLDRHLGQHKSST